MPRYHRAVETALGFGASSSLDPLGHEWFDAIARTPEGSAALMRKVNNKRADQKAKAAIRAGRVF